MSEEGASSHYEGSGYDSQDERPAERLGPVGASDSVICDAPCSYYPYGDYEEVDRLHRLEEEQEQLNASLLALTTHFAQVQFRLKQIVDASPTEKEELLKSLEEFAFRGIPNAFDYKCLPTAPASSNEQEHEAILAEQRMKQKELIDQLKEQLEDLETYAYETGEAGMPQSMMMEKHKVVLEQLKGKLAINLDSMDKMSPEELRQQVDFAIKELVTPAKMKEQLVGQLKTQITDLERFIEFLQGEVTNNQHPHCTCNCPVHGLKKGFKPSKGSPNCTAEKEPVNSNTVKIVQRVIALLQIFTLTQFGCGTQVFEKNILKKTSKANHWGDLRANLEIAVNTVSELAVNQEPISIDSDYTSDSEDVPVVQCNEKLTTAVRKDLSSAIRDLIQHGLMPIGQSTSLMPFGCLPLRSATTTNIMHAWDLVLRYYELKNGRLYNASPARKLSQSFNLEIVGGAAITSKQTLLGAIDNIISTHTPLKRSADSHFKAFICAAINEKKLVPWLRLILRCRPLIDRFYQPWSYTIKTGFEDSFRSLERLNQFDFDLPTDLAVRQLQNIKDAF